ncbi:type II secretion system F family protein [Cupriavidus basilensis]
MFANTKQKLPTLTIVMLALSDFVRNWWWAALAVIAVIAMIVRSLLKQPAVRLEWHRLAADGAADWQADPGLQHRALCGHAGHSCLRRGTDPAQFAGRWETLTNEALRANVEDATTRVREGASLARALAAQNQFPPVLVHLIRSGEATGNLPVMLDRAAQGEAQELERRTLFLTSLLEPLLISTMGVVVPLIVLAVLMPIIEINQLVK